MATTMPLLEADDDSRTRFEIEPVGSRAFGK
jgi:hypothetical protein